MCVCERMSDEEPNRIIRVKKVYGGILKDYLWYINGKEEIEGQNRPECWHSGKCIGLVIMELLVQMYRSCRWTV